MDAAADSPAPFEPLPLAELATAAARIAGVDFRPRDPIWLSRFTDGLPNTIGKDECCWQAMRPISIRRWAARA
jgi:hypothetical protein